MSSKYPYHIMVGPTYSDQFDILYKYIKDKQGSGPAPKVALVYTATEFGRDPIEHAKASAKKLGINIVAEEETKWSGIDVTPHVIKLRNAAPDYVIFQGYAGNLWPEIVKLSREYGIKAQFMGTVYGVQPDLVKGAGPAADGMLGVHAVRDDGRGQQRLGHEGGRRRAQGLGQALRRLHQRRLHPGLGAGDVHA